MVFWCDWLKFSRALNAWNAAQHSISYKMSTTATSTSTTNLSPEWKAKLAFALAIAIIRHRRRSTSAVKGAAAATATTAAQTFPALTDIPVEEARVLALAPLTVDGLTEERQAALASCVQPTTTTTSSSSSSSSATVQGIPTSASAFGKALHHLMSVLQSQALASGPSLEQVSCQTAPQCCFFAALSGDAER